MIIIIKCFLHAFIKIRERAKHLKETFHQLSEQVWNVHHATDAATFRTQAETLRLWAEQHTTSMSWNPFSSCVPKQNALFWHMILYLWVRK
jgi:hypothetical protein